MKRQISYAITVCNEHEELDKLLQCLYDNMNKENSEIVILMDEYKTTDRVAEIVQQYLYTPYNLLTNYKYKSHKLNMDFSDHKNYLNSLCTGEYIFQIDADEVPQKYLLKLLPDILVANPTVDLFYIPRINIVNNIDQTHINQWGWTIDKNNWVNFPDYQGRVFKNNSNIYWKNKVHEKIVGINTYSHLPASEEFCLTHIKDIKKQIYQNEFYNKIIN